MTAVARVRAALPGLLLTLLLALPGCAGPAPATLIVAGGAVRTLDGPGTAGAVALRGDTVVAVGSRADVLTLRGPGTVVVELEDEATVLPAFTDHHVHVLNLGLALLNRRADERYFMDLSGHGPLPELESRVARRAAEAGTQGWVLGQGWSQAAFGTQALPDTDALDRAAPSSPVFLTRIDAHAGWANAVALAAAGLDRSSPDPPGGRIVRRADGSLTGVLLERAAEPVLDAIPPLPLETLVAAFRAGAEHLAATGVTVAYDAGFLATPGIVDLGTDFGPVVEAVAADDAADPLPVRIHLMVPAPSPFAAELLERPERRALSPRLRITHLKLFADGALGSRGAALSHPYADDPGTHGVPRMTEVEILDWSRRALDAGLDVATHAIGDAAVATTLDAYERILAERPDLDPARLRIEHFSYAAAADFDRAVALGVPLSIQSGFNSPPDADPTFGEMRVGADRADRVYAWDRLDRMGALLLEGSDFYALPPPALFTLHAALTAQGALGVRGDGAAGRLDAVRLATRYLPPGGGSPRPGRLAPGWTGGLMVLSGDPLTVPLDSLLDLEVLLTVRGGRVVHDGREGQ